jgi:hypothetical protein
MQETSAENAGSRHKDANLRLWTGAAEGYKPRAVALFVFADFA